MDDVSEIATECRSSILPSSRRKVLVVDDDITLLKGLELNLRREGYDVIEATTGDLAVDAAVRYNPDLVVLDIMLPDTSGLDVCRTLRQHRLQCVILILTVKSDEIDHVLGLEIGADDYLTKPFSLRELLARIRAHMRRRPLSTDGKLTQFSFADVDLDFESSVARRRGRAVELTPKEVDLLRFLIANCGEVVSRERILECVWGYAPSTTTRTVDNHILRLRQKLEADPKKPRHILSAYGEGYRFVS